MNANAITIQRIFISHSRKDKAFGDVLVKLLRDIGLTQRQIIYTSGRQLWYSSRRKHL